MTFGVLEDREEGIDPEIHCRKRSVPIGGACSPLSKESIRKHKLQVDVLGRHASEGIGLFGRTGRSASRPCQ